MVSLGFIPCWKKLKSSCALCKLCGSNFFFWGGSSSNDFSSLHSHDALLLLKAAKQSFAITKVAYVTPAQLVQANLSKVTNIYHSSEIVRKILGE